MFILTGYNRNNDGDDSWNVAVSNDRYKLEAKKTQFEKNRDLQKVLSKEYFTRYERLDDQFKSEGKFPPKPASTPIPKLPNRMDEITPEMRAERAAIKAANDLRTAEWSEKMREIVNQLHTLLFEELVAEFGDTVSSCNDIHTFLSTFVHFNTVGNEWSIEEIDEV
jgi:hypothetical protein